MIVIRPNSTREIIDKQDDRGPINEMGFDEFVPDSCLDNASSQAVPY